MKKWLSIQAEWSELPGPKCKDPFPVMRKELKKRGHSCLDLEWRTPDVSRYDRFRDVHVIIERRMGTIPVARILRAFDAVNDKMFYRADCEYRII